MQGVVWWPESRGGLWLATLPPWYFVSKHKVNKGGTKLISKNKKIVVWCQRPYSETFKQICRCSDALHGWSGFSEVLQPPNTQNQEWRKIRHTNLSLQICPGDILHGPGKPIGPFQFRLPAKIKTTPGFLETFLTCGARKTTTWLIKSLEYVGQHVLSFGCCFSPLACQRLGIKSVKKIKTQTGHEQVTQG